MSISYQRKSGPSYAWRLVVRGRRRGRLKSSRPERRRGPGTAERRVRSLYEELVGLARFAESVDEKRSPR